MKNVHLLYTKEPSRLVTINNCLTSTNQPDFFSKSYMDLHKYKWSYMYITNDDIIKEGDPQYDIDGDISWAFGNNPKQWEGNKKIILTNDLELIKEGVQAIDDEFLDWFVKNPTCEYVEIKETSRCCGRCNGVDDLCYVDMCCDNHKKYGCEICYGKRVSYKVLFEKEIQPKYPNWNKEEIEDIRNLMLSKLMIPKEYFGSDDEMMEVPMPISKEPKKEYTEQDMLLAAKYGYDFHKTTSFPEQDFEDSCVRNTQQWLTTLK